ncbi:MAG: phosphotyrosine protein phosphatase [Candidatus Accumulibacter phosphatis]|uniref:Phosphotyrosine protein phosphatase n=1 Tax=Candidatus Accumulibacter phosphatis TaxID=327160 RepID=A0A6A7RS13_9PROT|nr:phosphotyrosine protein phosphatase [Candidatus Accumulibacter phosphatis]
MLKRYRFARQTVRHLTAVNYGTFRGWVRHFLAQLEWVIGRLDRFVVVQPKSVKRLVFVCLGNINRSAFAEAVAGTLGAHACSLGLATTTGAPAFETAVTTAQRLGIDLLEHAATDLSDFSYRPGDLLLTMEIRHVHRLIENGIPAEAIALLGAWSNPRRLHLHDPALQSEDYFMTCFVLIHSATINLVGALRAGGSPCVRP